ncbi:hypothetical protein [Streptomyces sp. NBC_00035]|uniref:hypothetical protein n=1 Tax=Streptomyces sp. NBC_00035 TaxID=2903614 RepID=UPI0032497EA9
MTDTDELTSDTHPAAPAVPSAPADRAALREQIAAAMREHYLCTDRAEADADGNLPCRCGDWREPGPMGSDEDDWDSHLADAVLAVLPATTDRAAVYTEVADRLAADAERGEKEGFTRIYRRSAAKQVREWADELRRVADEAQPATRNPSVITDRVLSEVLAERIRQDGEWGEQNHPDGTGGYEARRIAEDARRNCKAAAERGIVTWLLISDEEHCEALAESDPAKLRAELIQDAAVKVAWIEAIDRRAAAAEEPT